MNSVYKSVNAIECYSHGYAGYHMHGRQFKDGIEKNTDIMENSKNFLNSFWYKISYNPVISLLITYAKEMNINLYANVDFQPSYSVFHLKVDCHPPNFPNENCGALLICKYTRPLSSVAIRKHILALNQKFHY